MTSNDSAILTSTAYFADVAEVQTFANFNNTFAHNEFSSVKFVRFNEVSSGKRFKANPTSDDVLVSSACEEFLSAVHGSVIEYGYESLADRVLSEFLTNHQHLFVNLIIKLSSITYDDPVKYSLLLKSLGSIEYSHSLDELFIPIMAAGCHENRYVQEAMLHLYESWCAPQSLRFLRSIRMNTEWLERYKNKVIGYIESMDG